METSKGRLQSGRHHAYQDPGSNQPSHQRQPRHLPVDKRSQESHLAQGLLQDGQQYAVQNSWIRRLRRSREKILEELDLRGAGLRSRRAGIDYRSGLRG